MKKSGKVIGCHCPVVDAPVFYLREYEHYTYEDSVWRKVSAFNKTNPYPKVRGFKAASGGWTGPTYGTGRFIEPVHSMDVPFVESDYEYANLIIDALYQAGYKPGIEKYKVVG
jgi:hypothetical protein